MRFIYDVRYINDIECRPLMESESIDDNIIAVLCKIDDFSFFWNKLKTKLLNLSISERRDYLLKLFHLARLRPKLFEKLTIDLRKEVDDMPLTIDKEKDPLYREGLEEGIERGVLEGIEKGIKEGIERGREQGIKEGIKLALEIKFGGEGLIFFNRYVKDIKDIEKLKELEERIKRAKSIEDL